MARYSTYMWGEYFEKTKDMEPNDLLKKALMHVEGNQALDLGAGALRDSRFLAKNGFQVTAVDGSPLILTQPSQDNVSVVHSTFMDYDFPDNALDLVTAQWALSFNPRQTFPALIQKIIRALKSGGIFTANIFGTDDEWNKGQDEMTFLGNAQCQKTLEEPALDVIYFADVHERKKPAVGNEKRWHYFEIIARKP